MIRIGEFEFSETRTSLRVNMIEAKSKVRKEIQIRSYLDLRDGEQRLDALLAAVESFDRFEAVLSLQPGRYYQGRRRDFQVMRIPNKRTAWVDLLILTDDRFERGAVLHQFQATSISGLTEISLTTQGNWNTPLTLELQSSQAIESLSIEFDQKQFLLTVPDPVAVPIVIESESHSVTQTDQVLTALAQGEFPYLKAGTTLITIHTMPSDVEVQTSITYRDRWV